MLQSGLRKPFEEAHIPGIKPFSGWSLTAISELDLHAPGMAGHFLRASDERRQVMAAYLSTFPRRDRDAIRLPNDPSVLRELARRLMAEDHRTLLARAFGDVPEGLRGALRRSGSQPHSPRFYRLLDHILRYQRRPEVGKVIQRLDKIDLTRLMIACILPDELLHPRLIATLRDRSEARDVVMSVDLLRKAAVNSEGFKFGLRSLREGGNVREYTAKWLLRCRYAPSPVPTSKRYAPITNGEMLSQKALEYRNCSRSYAADFLEGKAALGEFSTDEESVLVLLKQRHGEWFLDDVYSHRNREVNELARRQVVDHLRLQGIFEHQTAPYKQTPFSSLRRLAARGVWM